jgi:hypothetical protein
MACSVKSWATSKVTSGILTANLPLNQTTAFDLSYANFAFTLVSTVNFTFLMTKFKALSKLHNLLQKAFLISVTPFAS